MSAQRHPGALAPDASAPTGPAPLFTADESLLLRAGLRALLRDATADATARIVALRNRLRAIETLDAAVREQRALTQATATLGLAMADPALVERDAEGREIITTANRLHAWIAENAPEIAARASQYDTTTLPPQPAAVAIDKAETAQRSETLAMFDRFGHPFADAPDDPSADRIVTEMRAQEAQTHAMADAAALAPTYVSPRKVAVPHPTLPGWTYSHTDAEGDHYTHGVSAPIAPDDMIDPATRAQLVAEGASRAFGALERHALRAALTAARHQLATLDGLRATDDPRGAVDDASWTIDESTTLALIDAALAGTEPR